MPPNGRKSYSAIIDNEKNDYNVAVVTANATRPPMVKLPYTSLKESIGIQRRCSNIRAMCIHRVLTTRFIARRRRTEHMYVCIAIAIAYLLVCTISHVYQHIDRATERRATTPGKNQMAPSTVDRSIDREAIIKIPAALRDDGNGSTPAHRAARCYCVDGPRTNFG
jgi:hypothetical protein